MMHRLTAFFCVLIATLLLIPPWMVFYLFGYLGNLFYAAWDRLTFRILVWFYSR